MKRRILEREIFGKRKKKECLGIDMEKQGEEKKRYNERIVFDKRKTKNKKEKNKKNTKTQKKNGKKNEDNEVFWFVVLLND